MRILTCITIALALALSAFAQSNSCPDPVCGQVKGNYAYQLVKSSPDGTRLVVTGVLILDGRGNLSNTDTSVPGEVRPSQGNGSDVTFTIEPKSKAVTNGSALIRFHRFGSVIMGPWFTVLPTDLDTGCSCYRKILIVGSDDTTIQGTAEKQ